MDKSATARLVNVKKAIRKKLLALKLKRSKKDEIFIKQYKPIIDPLKSLLQKPSVIIQKNIKKATLPPKQIKTFTPKEEVFLGKAQEEEDTVIQLLH